MLVRKVCRQKCCLVFALIILFFISLIFRSLSSYHKINCPKTLTINESNSLLSLIPPTEKDPKVNVILVWTKYYGGDFPKFWTSTNDPECLKPCQFTTDRRYLGISDAVIFHSRALYLRKNVMPPIRTSSQIYIYLQRESPSYTYLKLEDYDNVFNWTMTYRQDSDVYHPYFRIVKLNPVERQEATANSSVQQIHQQKTKLVAWIVSHCKTEGRRDKYVDELKKFIPVDIYGGCGNLSCANKDGEGCFPSISKQYKFYLSFENSLCLDYITEKFSRALQHNIVPIVYGGADYKTLVPPGSYINTKDFESPKALAEYLVELDSNPAKYLEYFGWKREYKVEDGNGWCSLCQKLTEHKRKPVMKSYANLNHWWNIYDGVRKNSLTKQFKNENEVFYEILIPACSHAEGVI